MKKTVLLTVLLIIFTNMFAQRNNTLVTIGNKKISDDEFKYIYLKNNNEKLGSKTPEDYLDLFVNFKLFVIDAENQKMDTTKQFQSEYQLYKDQLAIPYLTQTKYQDEITKELYYNYKTDVKFDLIFIKVSNRASKKQLAVAKAKAEKIRRRIENGEDFAKVARETSDQKGVAQNGGRYPFMQLFQLPYDMQEFMAKAPIGKLSTPFKTGEGFYLLKVIARRDNPGYVKVAHIMVAVPPQTDEATSTLKAQKADSIWQQLQAGADFAELAKKHSDDKYSGNSGGELPQFTSGRMVEAFQDASFALSKPGEYTKPVKTQFGYHIIKLIEKKPLNSYERQKMKLDFKVKNSPDLYRKMQAKVRKELSRKYALQSYKKSNDALFKMLDSSLFKAKWKYEDNPELSTVLLKIRNKEATLRDFANYIQTSQKREYPLDLKKYYDDKFDEFVYQQLVDYERNKLEKENTKYVNVLKEYRDGMLLFEYKKKYIWDKATNDSMALQNYYENNKDKFKSKPQIQMNIYEYRADKTLRKLNKYNPQELSNISEKTFRKKILKKTDLKRVDNKEIYQAGENAIADKVIAEIEDNNFKGNVLHFKNEKRVVFIKSKKIEKAQALKDIKGLVISEYQNELENQRVQELKKKYPVKINYGILKRLKFEL